MFIAQAPGVCTIKHYGFVIYGRRSKLLCLFVQANVFVQTCVLVQAKRHSLTYYEIFQLSINYEFVMFRSTGPEPCTLKLLKAVIVAIL